MNESYVIGVATKDAKKAFSIMTGSVDPSSIRIVECESGITYFKVTNVKPLTALLIAKKVIKKCSVRLAGIVNTDDVDALSELIES